MLNILFAFLRRGDRMLLKLERQFPSGLPRDEKELVVTALNYDYNTARITVFIKIMLGWL